MVLVLCKKVTPGVAIPRYREVRISIQRRLLRNNFRLQKATKAHQGFSKCVVDHFATILAVIAQAMQLN
jgi:hypothetical protein